MSSPNKRADSLLYARRRSLGRNRSVIMQSEEQRHVEAGATNLRTAAAASIMRPKPASPAAAANTTIINSSSSSHHRHHHHHHHHDETIIRKASSPTTKPNNNACRGILWGVSWLDVYYIATWGIFGAVLRIYLARLFGLDCETAESGDLWHASNVCITASGQTSRKGGAIFIDLYVQRARAVNDFQDFSFSKP